MIYSFENLLKPIGGLETFEKKYRDKNKFIIKGNKGKFADHFSFNQLDNYLNQVWDDKDEKNRAKALQVIFPNGSRWCRKKSKIQYTRENLKTFWDNGCTFVIPIMQQLNRVMWNQVDEFEKYWGVGQANIYTSKKKDAYCFPIHADSTDNFLFHVDGKIRWHIYKETKMDLGKAYPDESEVTLEDIVELDAGDLLYLPIGKFHKAEPLEARISISYHFNKGKPNKYPYRREWINWMP